MLRLKYVTLMHILRLIFLSHVVLGICYKHNCGDTATQFRDSGNDSYFRNLPCPNAEDIEPCVCTEDDGVIDLQCDNIADEQQLYDIFHSDIPVPDFRKLTLGTTYLETLPDDVFGEVTFEEVWADNGGALKSVGTETFMNSATTLKKLYLKYNKLSDFPFGTLGQYTLLEDLSLMDNPISSFPIIKSETLTYLDMGGGAFDTIPAGALNGLPNLKIFHAEGLILESMATGLFTSLSKISEIYMPHSRLEHLESLQFGVNDSVIESIYLFGNKISSVDTNTFKGVQSGTIWLENNELTIIPEATWRSVIDAGVKLKLQGNVLTCGCDVAWLVLEPTYHELVEAARCGSGEILVDLDPSWFENNC